MTASDLGRAALQARIAMIRVGVVPYAIAILLLPGAISWIGFAVNVLEQGRQEQTLAQTRQGLGDLQQAGTAAMGFATKNNLRDFYDDLGDRPDTEQYLKTIFAIAEQTDLSLDHGEYQEQTDKDSGTYRYRVLLPVTGSYTDIRRFCEKTLLALPFASLDELSFKRESVDDDALVANLRFTLYLKDALRARQQTEAAK